MRSRFGFGVDRIDRGEVSAFTLTSTVCGLLDDHSSHTFASVAGWAYVPDPAEVQFYNGLDVKLAMNRGKNQPTPPRTKRPWEQSKQVEVTPKRDAEERARRDLLKRRLGIAS